MFAKVMSVVLGILGISAFAKDEKGKSILLSTQEEELKKKYGDVSVSYTHLTLPTNSLV